MTDLPNLKLKTLPVFPGNIIGGTGIEATKANGHVTVDLAFNEFATQSFIPTSPTNNVVTYDTATDTYVMVPSALLGGAASGVADAPFDGLQYGRQSGTWTSVNANGVQKTGDTMSGALGIGTAPMAHSGLDVLNLGINLEVTDPQMLAPVTTFLNGGDGAADNKAAASVFSTLTSGALAAQIGPALNVQQIVGAGVTGFGAAGAIYGGTQFDRDDVDGYGILGVVNNTGNVLSPSGCAVWALVRGEHAGTDGRGIVDGLRASTEAGHGIYSTPRTVTISIASPAVFTLANHGFTESDQVSFETTGALPTNVQPFRASGGVVYFVMAAGLTANTFQIAQSPGGVAVNTAGTQSGTHTVFSPQTARSGLFVTNNLQSNPFLAGAYVQSATQYGFRVGSGGSAVSIYEPTYPFAYMRKGGAQPFHVNQTGDVFTRALSFPGGSPGIDFTNGTTILRSGATGALILTAQNGIVEAPAIKLPVGSTGIDLGGGGGTISRSNTTGNTIITSQTNILDVPVIQIATPAAHNPQNNSTMTFVLTDNTHLAIKVKGTDGVVRTATLTLA